MLRASHRTSHEVVKNVTWLRQFTARPATRSETATLSHWGRRRHGHALFAVFCLAGSGCKPEEHSTEIAEGQGERAGQDRVGERTELHRRQHSEALRRDVGILLDEVNAPPAPHVRATVVARTKETGGWEAIVEKRMRTEGEYRALCTVQFLQRKGLRAWRQLLAVTLALFPQMAERATGPCASVSSSRS
jgi:hypothetical protein